MFKPDKHNLIQEMQQEADAALELLQRADWQFDALAQEGYLNRTQKDLWTDIRSFLQTGFTVPAALSGKP